MRASAIPWPSTAACSNSVTLAVAVLMTVAGFEMLQDVTTVPLHHVATPGRPAHVAGVVDRLGDKVAMPHVAELRA